LNFIAINTFSLSDIITKELLKLYELSNLNFIVEFKKNTLDIVYKTNFCLQLGKILQKSPLIIAENIVNNYARSNLSNYFILKICLGGWLEFMPLDRLVNQWLNEIKPFTIILDSNNQKSSKITNFFPIYYTHDRCCSLLKSAHKQNIITLNQTNLITNQWWIKEPNFINYIPLLKKQSYEYQLIKDLIKIREKIAHNKINYLITLNNLSESILKVECYGRIWGETLIKNPSLSQARLGLIALSLYYYQNIYFAEFRENLPLNFL